MNSSIEEQGGMFYVIGQINEHTSFDSLIEKPGPLKLNFSKLISMNSLGIRVFINFLGEYSGGPIEYHECPKDFVDSVNMIMQLTSANPAGISVKSVVIPLDCRACGRGDEILVDIDVYTTKGAKIVTGHSCSNCGSRLTPGVEIEDHFLFLEC